MASVTAVLPLHSEFQTSRIRWQDTAAGLIDVSPLRADAGTAHVVRFQLSGNGADFANVAVIRTVVLPDGSSGTSGGPHLSDAAETFVSFATISVPGMTDLVLAGPNNPNVGNQDPTEPYQWRPGSDYTNGAITYNLLAAPNPSAGLAGWVGDFLTTFAADNTVRATLTLDDGQTVADLDAEAELTGGLIGSIEAAAEIGQAANIDAAAELTGGLSGSIAAAAALFGGPDLDAEAELTGGLAGSISAAAAIGDAPPPRVTAVEARIGTGSWEAITSVIEPGITWTRRRRTQDGHAASDNLRLRLRGSRDADLVRSLAQERAVSIRLLDGTDVLWIGDLLPGRDLTTDGQEALIGIEAVDRLQQLRPRASSSYSAAGATLDTVAVQLANRAGIAAADQSWPAEISLITIGYAGMQEDEEVWPVLEQIMWEHGWTLDTTAAGGITATRWWHTVIGAPDDAPSLVRPRIELDIEAPAAVVVEWAETDTLEGVTVWEGAGGTEADGTLSPAHAFTDDGDEWPDDDTWLSYRTDWVAQQAPLARRSAESDDYQLLRVAGHEVSWTGTDISLTTETHEALRSQLQWTASADAAELTTAVIRGDVTFRAYTQRERAEVEDAFGSERVVATRYLSSQAAAQRLAAALRDRHSPGAWLIRAQTFVDAPPDLGDLVRVQEPTTGFDRVCEVIERTDRPMRDGKSVDGPVDLVFQPIRALDTAGADADGRVIPAAAPVVRLGPRAVWVPRGSESTWSDRAAEQALGQPNTGDQVTQYQETGGTWAQTRRWDGDAWVTVTAQLLGAVNAPSSARDFIITALVDRDTSATWSDSAANAAIPNRIEGDTVVQFRSAGGHWAQARYWTGATWVKRTAQIIPGDLLVEGTVRAIALIAGGITVTQIAADTFHVPLRRLAVDADTTDNAIYDHLDAGVVLNGELAIQGAILQSERVILPLVMRRTAASTIRIWFYGDLLAPSGRVKTVDLTDGGTGTSLSDKLGEVLSGSWIGW